MMSFYSSEITLTKNQLVREAARITFQNIELLHEICLQYYKGKNSNINNIISAYPVVMEFGEAVL